ncbi:reverse transcriptase domain-containing protein [Tanacetum coccineum]
MALALRHVSRRLRRYFEAHPITVITDQPIKQVLNKADTSGRLAPYSVELAAYNITYEPRSAIKGQVLADFINEIPVGSDAVMPRQTQYTVDHDKDCKEEWVLYTDGASSAKGSGVGLVLNRLLRKEQIILRQLCNSEDSHRAMQHALKGKVGGSKSHPAGVEELPNILWAHRTSLKTSNGETPYSLTFGSEAVILVEIGMPTHRTMMIKEENGNEVESRPTNRKKKGNRYSRGTVQDESRTILQQKSSSHVFQGRRICLPKE